MDTTTTLADIVRTHGSERADRPMLTFEGRTLTFGEVHERSSRVAQALAAAGVRRGSRVGFLDKNVPEYFDLVFGAAKLDAVTVAVSWRLAAPEVRDILVDAGVLVLVVGTDFSTVVERIEDDLPGVTIVALGKHDRWASFEDWISEHPPTDPGITSTPDSVAFQLYTSGTTGVPKGVMLTNANVFALFPVGAQAWSFDADMVSLGVMPVSHISGTGWNLAVMYFGGHSVLLREVDADTILRTIEGCRVTHAVLVPAVIQMLLATPGIADVDLSSLRMILYGASPINAGVLVRALEVFPCGFTQAYGMTETTGAVTQLDPQDHDPARPHLLRSCGRPLPGVELRIVEPITGADAEPGAVGEVWIRSAQNMAGYWGRPEETAAVLTDDGWVRSGDAGYVVDGFLYLHDRLKDMVVTGGENVYPAEVESVLSLHPAVGDVAVIGVPDDRWGETVKAMVVPAPGCTVEPGEVIQFAREHLAHFKCPTSVDVVDDLPRNPSGKLLKREIREPFWHGRDRRIGGGAITTSTTAPNRSAT